MSSNNMRKANTVLAAESVGVSFLTEDSTSAQFRYRCNNVKESLGVGRKWRVIWSLRSKIGSLKVGLRKSKLTVIGRQTDKDGAVGKLIRQVHKYGGKVIFDLDDLIFDYRDLPILMKSTNSRNAVYWMGYIWGIRRIAKRVDGFTCTNEFLAGKLKRSFGKPVRVIPNSLNKEQIEVSEQAIKKKKVRKNVNDEFVIGYFSGSPTHARDFALVEPELIRFLKEYENVKLVVVGYMKFSKQMRELIDAGRVEVMGVVDYFRLQELMSKVDVNIAPLVINDFTNCKSELKFFEAAAVETTTIASPNYSFKKAITDGKNGFLAKPGEWYQKLKYLYNHPEENRKIALEAKKYALKHYYGEEFLKEVEVAYDYFAK